MKRVELIVVDYAEVMDTDKTVGLVDPHNIGVMWRDKTREGSPKYPRMSMLASAWLIQHYKEDLHNGVWPEVRPEEIPAHGGAFHHGPQEMPGMFAAEISVRMRECGRDGLALLEYYSTGERLTDNRTLNKTLEYCSGWRRKRQPYVVWCNNMKRDNPAPVGRPAEVVAEVT